MDDFSAMRLKVCQPSAAICWLFFVMPQSGELYGALSSSLNFTIMSECSETYTFTALCAVNSISMLAFNNHKKRLNIMQKHKKRRLLGRGGLNVEEEKDENSTRRVNLN